MKRANLFIVLILFFGLNETKAQETFIKNKIINNYLHFVAENAPTLNYNDPEGFDILTLPKGYEHYLELKKFPAPEQFLDSMGIELYQFSGLGLAFNYQDSTKSMYNAAGPHRIENSGYHKSSNAPYNGCIGFSKKEMRVLYFSGPLILHDLSLLIFKNGLNEININSYVQIKYFDKGTIENLKISYDEQENKQPFFYASFDIENIEYFVSFRIERFTQRIIINTL